MTSDICVQRYWHKCSADIISRGVNGFSGAPDQHWTICSQHATGCLSVSDGRPIANLIPLHGTDKVGYGLTIVSGVIFW